MSRASATNDPEVDASDALTRDEPVGRGLLDEKALAGILKQAEPCAWKAVFEDQAQPSVLLRCEVYEPSFAIESGLCMYEVVTKTFCDNSHVEYRRGFLTDAMGRFQDELLMPYAAEGKGSGGWLQSVPRAWAPIRSTDKWVVAYHGYQEFYVTSTSELKEQLGAAKNTLGDLFSVKGQEPA